MREINSFRDLQDELERRFPNQLPAISSADPAEVNAAFWRARGRQDVVELVRNLIDPKRSRTAQPQE